jgi:hypothetical protein
MYGLMASLCNGWKNISEKRAICGLQAAYYNLSDPVSLEVFKGKESLYVPRKTPHLFS